MVDVDGVVLLRLTSPLGETEALVEREACPLEGDQLGPFRVVSVEVRGLVCCVVLAW